MGILPVFRFYDCIPVELRNLLSQFEVDWAEPIGHLGPEPVYACQ